MCGKVCGKGRATGRSSTTPRGRLTCKDFKRKLKEFAMRNIDDLKTMSFWRGVLAEFTACFFLVLVGCGASVETDEYPITMRVAFSFGFMYAVLIYSLRHISGGHVNPAVSIAMAATCKVSIARALLYVVAQVLGAILGAAVLFGITAEQLRGSLGCTVPQEYVSEGQGFGVEFFATMILVFITFACFEEHNQEDERRCPGHLVVGLTVAALICFAAPLTGGSFNAARSFGPAVVRGIWKYHWIYWFGTILGGLLGGVIYDIVFSKNATLKKLVSCMAGSGRPSALGGSKGSGINKKEASPEVSGAVVPVATPKGKDAGSESERQALRSSGDSLHKLEESEESGDEAAKAAAAQMC